MHRRHALCRVDARLHFDVLARMTVSSGVFHRIYFETSALRDGGWPRGSGVLEDVFGLSAELGFTLLIPRAVEVELETLWLRGLYELRNDEKVVRHVAGITEVGLLPPVDWERVRSDYRTVANAQKAKWGIRSVPLTLRRLDEVFQWTIAPEPPFENKRPGLRDAAIYHSIVEDLRAAPGQRAILVAQDKGFALLLDRPEEMRLKDLGVELVVFDQARLRAKLREIQQARESEEERAVRERDEARARRALERHRSSLEEFVSAHLMYRAWDFGVAAERVLGVDVGEITNVTVTRPPARAARDQPVTILAEVRVAPQILAMPMPILQPFPPARGDEPPPLYSSPQQQDVGSSAVVEIKAVQRNDEYQIIEFVSAMLIHS